MLLGGGFLGSRPVSVIGLIGVAASVNRSPFTKNAIQHGRVFGQTVSLPQGYNSLAAVHIPVKTGSKISARLQGNSDIVASISAAMKAAASLQADSGITANAVRGLVGIATLAGEGGLAASIAAALKARATLDAGARPSAFDIAQEIWQSPKTAYNATGTMGNALNAAGSGGVDLNALAAAVWAYASRSLTGAQANQLRELFEIHGLDPAKPLEVTDTTRSAGAISQTVASSAPPSGATVSVTRLP